jgi:hypothetical protein
MLHRLASSSSPIHDTHATPSPEGRGPIRCSRSLRGSYCPVLHKNVLFADSCYRPCYPGTSHKTCPTRTTGGGIFTHGRARAGDLTGRGQVAVKQYGIRLMTEILYVCSPMMSFLMSWAADCPTWAFSQYREKNCSSALRPNRHRSESRAFQGHAER